MSEEARVSLQLFGEYRWPGTMGQLGDALEAFSKRAKKTTFGERALTFQVAKNKVFKKPRHGQWFIATHRSLLKAGVACRMFEFSDVRVEKLLWQACGDRTRSEVESEAGIVTVTYRDENIRPHTMLDARETPNSVALELRYYGEEIREYLDRMIEALVRDDLVPEQPRLTEKQCRSPQQAGDGNEVLDASEENRPASEPVPSEDFSIVTWGVQIYRFSMRQSACVKVLWESRPDEVSGRHVLEKAGSHEDSLGKVFRIKVGSKRQRHPAWKTLIVSDRQGLYRIK